MKIQTLLLLLCPAALLARHSFGEQQFSLIDGYRPWIEKYASSYDPNVDNDAWKTMKEIANENGFAHEEYKVTTSDGYILTLYRIPGFLNETKPYAKKPVVLLQHGLEADSMQWVINSPDKASAFNLVSEGFDVWLGNNRGCQYSVAHTTLDPVKNKTLFWDFDFEDMGTKDVPAEIDFILESTGQEKLSYVGHSEGTTQMFIGLSMLPEYYAEKMNLFVALAPVASLNHTMSTALKIMAANVDQVEHYLIDTLGMYNVFPPNYYTQWETAELCSTMASFCSEFLTLIADLDPSVDNLNRTMTYLTHFPSGAGYRNLVHYAQLINSDKFLRYDFGTAINQQKYGQSTPPEYPLEKINVPVGMFVGLEDELGDPEDCRWLHNKISKTVTYYKEYPFLGHMTFAIGKDMSFFQVDAINLIKQYATNSFE
ncbi:hypothetical protein FGO68_gene5820 [Halteria grandinella]|uniref:Lipase n=1 Tax=Halteria grandinella TaxID=5974 RepID=A0A8J8NQI5_HALGN|nr:hypothetical protein FGO68_gene5820 [Halteria grandinella]